MQIQVPKKNNLPYNCKNMENASKLSDDGEKQFYYELK